MPVPTGAFATELRSHVREALSSPPAVEPTPEPAAETPTEPPAAPAETPESPSPAEAAPSPAPEGTTPPAQPPPASDVPTTSAVEALSKRGFTVTDEKLAAEFLRVESEFAAMKRAEKTPKAPPAELQPEPQQTAPEPAPATKPTLTAPTAPEPPAPQVQPSTDLDQTVAQLAATDPTCVALVEDYRAVEAGLSDLWKVDRHGRPVGGRIFDLNAQIISLEQTLSPNEHLKKAGVPVPELDPIQRQDMERALLRFKLDRRDLIDDYNGGVARRSDAKKQYEERLKDLREPYERAAQAKAEAEQRDVEIETKANEFERTWIAAEAEALKRHNVQGKLQTKIRKLLKVAAHTPDGPYTPDDIPAFMERVIKDELDSESEIGEEYHRQKMAEYGRLKNADAQAAAQAPNGSAAVATPASTSNPDWQKALKAQVRAALS